MVNRQRSSRRAIILITTIILTVVLVMFLGAAIALGPGNLAAGQATLSQGHAQRAAESGIHYALSQIRQNPAWKGNRNGVTVNTPDLFVREDNGNVVGLVRNPDGDWSQFRLRFNYQDGAGGPDGLNDPAQLIDHQFVSINNLTGGGTADVPRGDGPGASVTGASAIGYQCPVWGVGLAVEGRSGPGCGQLSPANPNPPILGAVSRKVVEGIYQIPDMGPTIQESGSMSGKDFLTLLRLPAQNMTITSNSSSTPRVRAKGEVAVKAPAGVAGDLTDDIDANYVSPDGEVRLRQPGPGLQANYTPHSPGPPPTGVSVQAENLIDPFYQLFWNDVRKAPSSGPNLLPAGTYVWWDNGGGASLHYYDMTYDEYSAWISQPANATNPGVVIPAGPTANGALTVDLANKKLVVTGDIYVNPVTNGAGTTVDDLNVVARLGAAEAPPGSPEANSATTDAAVATALAADPTLLFQALQATQGAAMDLDGQTPTGSFDLDWVSTNPTSFGAYLPADHINGTVVTTNWTPAQQIDMQNILLLAAGLPAAPGYSLDTSSVTYTPLDLQVLAATLGLGGGSGSGTPNNGVLNPPGVSDTLSAADLSIEFAPTGTSAVLTAEGNVHLTSAISGVNGSITSGGDIKITGLGAQFAASQQSGVNMYAVGDIVFSTLDNDPNGGGYSYREVNLKGVIYAQGDFIANLGSEYATGTWGKLNLEGCLIAYGGDPSGAPGSNGKGSIMLKAEEVNVAFDSAYVGALTATPPANFTVECLSWTNRY